MIPQQDYIVTNCKSNSNLNFSSDNNKPNKCRIHGLMNFKGWYNKETGEYKYSCHNFYCKVHGIGFRKRLFHSGKEQIPETNYATTGIFFYNNLGAIDKTTKIIGTIKRVLWKQDGNAIIWSILHNQFNKEHIHFCIFHDENIDFTKVELSLKDKKSNLMKYAPEYRFGDWRAEYNPAKWLYYCVRYDQPLNGKWFKPWQGKIRTYYGFTGPDRKSKSVNEN